MQLAKYFIQFMSKMAHESVPVFYISVVFCVRIIFY